MYPLLNSLHHAPLSSLTLVPTPLQRKAVGEKLSLDYHVEGSVTSHAQNCSAIKSTLIVPSTNDLVVICNSHLFNLMENLTLKVVYRTGKHFKWLNGLAEWI